MRSDEDLVKEIYTIAKEQNITPEEALLRLAIMVSRAQQTPYLVGFSGKMGSGKSYVAKKLKEALESRANLKVEIESMAKPLQAALMQMTVATDYAEAKQETIMGDLTGRRFLQLMGTELGRECISPDIWVAAFKNRISRSTADIILVDDIRFENEAEDLNILVDVEADRTPPQSEHASESNNLFWDLKYINDTPEISEKLIDVIYDKYTSK